mmetsp:Transcript_3857/g.5650  ORF Transcript_3857/g.5650 Transcript_3857/m.5650 type:complete len:565 (-) Transcript_3857:136-1830(-)|eukprot:CAMPEP_0195529848 /NCGR_PEP_ID=MMETSP0794_2-20130614/32499_1 /TAXON_ID=515487 /ORGANISM="Stephanopyxis turris, Strain CCMP 815" /LENGTH=564 /DNA_ID=CAMNT_0040661219 /DNA_START=125 /DNA_END=1819 /DNA_ORIENTATION=+
MIQMHKTCAIVLLVCGLIHLSLAASDGKCSSGVTFQCPNCGGIEVTDCLECDGFLNTDLKYEMCFSRKLFNDNNTEGDPNEHYRHLWNDIVGTFVWFMAAGVATACGVGGGGIYVPLGIVLLQFAPKPASGLSQASIFGASLGGLVLNQKNKHPDKKIRDSKNSTCSDEEYVESGGKFYSRPLIDYDMVLFLAPMEMAGAVLGVLIQKLMPNWLYLFISSVILSFTSYKTYLKFFAVYAVEKVERKEREEAEKKAAEKEQLNGSTHPTEETSDPLNKAEKGSSPSNTENGNNEPQDNADDEIKLRREFLEEDSKQYPKAKILALLVLWIGLILLTFFKGGKGVESLIGIKCDSPWYAVLIALQFVWTLGFATVYGLKLLKRQNARAAVNYPYLPKDVLWDNKKLRFYSTFTFVAGIVAGLIGIGGGMVLGPLMLQMGIHPRVSSATTATMIVLTSSSVAILFVTAGLVPWEYAVFFFSVCLCGAYIGKKYIDRYVKRTGMSSVLIFILATIIALATMGCLVIVFLGLARNDWCFDGFKKFCDINDEAKGCAATRMLNLLTEVIS